MCISWWEVRLLRRDMVQQAAKVKIYTEQLQLQKLTLDDMGCMINHGGQGALDSRSRKTLWTGLRGMCISGTLLLSFTYKMINIFIFFLKSFMIIFTQRLHYNNIWRMTTVDRGPVNLWQTRYAPRSACWVSEGLRGQGSVFFFFTFMWSSLALGRWRTESLAPPSLVAINGCNLYPCKAVAVFKFHLFYPNEWWTLVQCTVEQY